MGLPVVITCCPSTASTPHPCCYCLLSAHCRPSRCHHLLTSRLLASSPPRLLASSLSPSKYLGNDTEAHNLYDQLVAFPACTPLYCHKVIFHLLSNESPNFSPPHPSCHQSTWATTLRPTSCTMPARCCAPTRGPSCPCWSTRCVAGGWVLSAVLCSLQGEGFNFLLTHLTYTTLHCTAPHYPTQPYRTLLCCAASKLTAVNPAPPLTRPLDPAVLRRVRRTTSSRS